MARERDEGRFEDEYDDVEPVRKPKKNSTVLIVVLCVAGALVLACGGGVVAFLSWGISLNQSLSSRDDFKTAVMGKNKDMVMKAAGEPEKTSTLGSTEYWTYTLKTRDPATGKIDSRTEVVFENGVVHRVNFN